MEDRKDEKHENIFISIETCDDQLQLPQTNVKCFNLTANMLSLLTNSGGSCIPLTNVSSKSLLSLINLAQKSPKERLQDLNVLSLKELKSLACVANFLDPVDQTLLDDLCMGIIKRIDGKSVEELSKVL